MYEMSEVDHLEKPAESVDIREELNESPREAVIPYSDLNQTADDSDSDMENNLKPRPKDEISDSEDKETAAGSAHSNSDLSNLDESSDNVQMTNKSETSREAGSPAKSISSQSHYSDAEDFTAETNSNSKPIKETKKEDHETTDENKEIPIDKNEKHPAYVPKNSRYFLHDSRAEGPADEADDPRKNKNHRPGIDADRWEHDKFFQQRIKDGRKKYFSSNAHRSSQGERTPPKKVLGANISNNNESAKSASTAPKAQNQGSNYYRKDQPNRSQGYGNGTSRNLHHNSHHQSEDRPRSNQQNFDLRDQINVSQGHFPRRRPGFSSMRGSSSSYRSDETPRYSTNRNNAYSNPRTQEANDIRDEGRSYRRPRGSRISRSSLNNPPSYRAARNKI